MIPFRYERADEAASATATLAQNPRAAYLGGGTNLVDHMKRGMTEPDVLVDVTHLPYDRVEPLAGGGLRAGATVRNSDLAADERVREQYPVLSQALLSGASGQLRNLATTGGNLLQRTRCVYFQDVTTPCNKREPGSGCSALDGYTRYHAILGASQHCVAVHPSDMAVALAALDAVVQVRSPTDGQDGRSEPSERSIPVTELHRLPGEEPHYDTVLDHGELITAVDLPALPAGTRSRYRKVRDRASYAFALVSVAAVLRVVDGEVADVRIALGGVAHKPWRARRAEAALQGAMATEEAFSRAADAELDGAQPLAGNAFKVPLTRSTLVSTLLELTEDHR